MALTICRTEIGVVPSKKRERKNLCICWVLRRFRDLTANILWTKRDVDNRGTVRWKERGVSYIVGKFHELWSTNGSK